MPALAELSWPAVPQGPTLVLPVGSTEQHGPHLPTGTDTLVAARVAEQVVGSARPVDHLLLAPALPYGASGEHDGFPGTVSIGQAALLLVLLELGRSALGWARRLVLVNGHGGNVPGLREAVVRLRSEGRDVAWAPCQQPGADAHAGRFETSLLLALAPASVQLDQARAGARAPLAELLPELRRGGVRAVDAGGVLGDPQGASEQEGHRHLAAMAAEVLAQVQRWRPDEAGRLR